MKQARGYQLEAEETVFQELELGCQSQIIEMATGLGKTFVGCLIAKRMKEYNPIPRVLWVTHTEELIEQSARALIYEFLGKTAVDYVLDEGDYLNVMSNSPDAFSNDMHKSIHENFGIVKAELMKITAPYVVASIQTLHRRLEQFTPNYFDLIVIDECFPAGTLVDGKPIETFKIGDYVNSFNHKTGQIEKQPILHLFKNKRNGNLIKVRLEDNTEFICTEGHPIFINELGYVSAKELLLSFSKMSSTLSVLKHDAKNPNLHNMSNDISSKTQQFEVNTLLQQNLCSKRNRKKKKNSTNELSCLSKRGFCSRKKNASSVKKRTSILFRRLQTSFHNRKYKKTCSLVEAKQRTTQAIFRKNEVEQSYEQSSYKAKNDRFFKRKNIFIKRGKRRINKTSNDASLGYRTTNGIPNNISRSKKQFSFCTQLLQSRLGRTQCKIGNRSRWRFSQTEKMDISGQEKNRNIKFVRLASVEIYQSRSGEKCSQVCQDDYVYNIEVKNNNNYFVEETLVHNCHYAGATTWKKTIDYFKPSLLLGLTATPKRTDGVSMTDIFDKIVFSRDIVFGIQNKHLCEIDAYTIKTSIDLDSVKTRGGDFATGELENLINTEERNEYIYQKWKLYAEDRPTLVFVVDVQHAQDLTKVFRKHGVLCDFVVGDKELTPERKAVMSAFTSGDLQVLVNVNIATTGFDYPNLGCLLMARPTKSWTLYMQMLGRGTRLKNEEVDFTDCIVLDIVDNTSRHKLINAASLEDGKRIEDRVFISQERREALIASRDARKMKEVKEEKRIKLIPLPEIKVYDTYRNREPATEAQLTLLERLGFEGSFTLGQAMEIINGFEANAAQIEFLRKHGYDVSHGVTFGQFSKISAELKRKEFAQKLRLPFTNIK